MNHVFSCDNQLAVKIVMPWISTAPPSQVSSSLLLISSVNKQMNPRLEEWASTGREQDVWPCFHLASSKVSRPCMHFGDGYAYNGCQQQLKREEWEWWEGVETATGKTSYKSVVLWICEEQISDIWRLDWEMAHLRTSNTCVLQCSPHVSMSFRNKRGVNSHSWFTARLLWHSVQGLWFGAVRSLTPLTSHTLG